MWSRRRRSRHRGLLPLRHPSSSVLTNGLSLSFWYCNYKTTIFNKRVYSTGQKHARFLRVWFTVGIGFGLLAMIGVMLIILLESSWLVDPGIKRISLVQKLEALLKGTGPEISSLNGVSSDIGHMVLGTLLSVGIHEFGHALSAASEGVHMTCFAVFLILLLPGAFVAFDNDTLQMLSHLQLLRIYCAGVWHNIVLCTVCWLSSMSLPVLLHVLYENGTNPVVLNVPTVSPLRGYLSAGDVISGLNGVPLHTPTEWIQELSLIHIQALKQHEITNAWSMNEQHIIAKQNASHANRGFCIPNDWLLLNPTMEGGSIDLGCSNGDLLFIEIPYSSHNYTVFQPTGNLPGVKQHFFCLRAKDVVQLPKCGHGWVESVTYQRHYCTKNEFCMDPVLPLGSVLIEVEHYKTSIPECLLQHNHAKPPNMSIPSISQEDKITSCKSSLLYEGNAAFLAHSVHLTGYKPQILTFLSTPLLWLPTILERLLKITFYVSAALALLNSAPIFYLDGQFILETILSYTHLKKRRFVLYFLLMCGTTLFLMSTLGGFRLLLFMA